MARYFIGESRKPARWDEGGIGAARNDAPVMRVQLLSRSGTMDACVLTAICRTAVYVTRSYGGVGRGSRKAFPHPD